MKNLRIRRKDSKGTLKNYRLSAESGQFIIGSSRKADLRFPSDKVLPIEGVIERSPQGWRYHSFAIGSNEIIFDLSQSQDIKVGDFTFSPEIIPDRSFYSIEADRAKPPAPNQADEKDGATKTQQAILIYFKNELWTTRTAPVGSTIDIDTGLGSVTIKTRESSEWLVEPQGQFLIRHKTIQSDDVDLFKVEMKEYLPKRKQDRWTIGVLTSTIILGMISTFTFKGTQHAAEVAPPKASSPLVLKLSPTQQKPAPKKEEKTADVQNNSAPANRTAQLKNLGSLGKAGLFLKKAVRMPSAIGPNGKISAAAAGIGRLEGPKADWNSMAGSKVSGQIAAGLSGGTGTGTQLAAGNVGQSGVNLLEQESEVSGGLDKEIIAALIRKNIGHILYCYERSLSANPNLFGKVSVRFTIGGSGKVESQKIGETTLRDKRVESCMLEKISNWKFPEPKGGVQVVVTYPFLFKTTN